MASRARRLAQIKAPPRRHFINHINMNIAYDAPAHAHMQSEMTSPCLRRAAALDAVHAACVCVCADAALRECVNLDGEIGVITRIQMRMYLCWRWRVGCFQRAAQKGRQGSGVRLRKLLAWEPRALAPHRTSLL